MVNRTFETNLIFIHPDGRRKEKTEETWAVAIV